MTAFRVGLFRQIRRFHRHAEFILAHGNPASKVDRRPRSGAAQAAAWATRTGSAFCLMRPPPATARPAGAARGGRMALLHKHVPLPP
ncbi:hypothetical protein [Burkholderia gladioli]|uniref:hypothetical protein n=1 Tax=Burkholderia gladioli TaxID=28095 RepID=UPI0031331F7C